MDDLQVDGFQVPCNGHIIPSINNTAPALEALRPKIFDLGSGVL
jgi:hypothetical protein